MAHPPATSELDERMAVNDVVADAVLRHQSGHGWWSTVNSCRLEAFHQVQHKAQFESPQAEQALVRRQRLVRQLPQNVGVDEGISTSVDQCAQHGSRSASGRAGRRLPSTCCTGVHMSARSSQFGGACGECF